MTQSDRNNFPTIEEMPSLLRHHGIFPTRQRVQVAEVLLSRPQHLTADRLMKLVNDHNPAVSRATVYNTLAAFVRAGLVTVVNIPGATAYYDSSTHEHAHIFDEDSGELTDSHVDVMRLSKDIPLPEGVELSGVDFVLHVRRKA